MQVVESFQYEDVQGFRFGSNPFGEVRMTVYSYFIDGLLIDTGHRNMRKTVVKKLDSLPVDHVFITHHHEDHTGNLKVLRQRFNCPTYASARCCEIMKAPPSISFAQRISWGPRPADHQLTPIEGFLETPNHRFELIPVPGHAADMLALYEPNRGWLFSADLWVSDFILVFMRAESMIQQIESLKRVTKLDFEVLFCSHRPQLKDGKIRIRKKLQFLEDFFGQVETGFQKGMGEQAIFEAMKLKERQPVKFLSGGELSQMNMVRSALRDLRN
ncbi:MAG: MBL fold metallo-hydrolase, partial [Bacteroidota bacterium]